MMPGLAAQVVRPGISLQLTTLQGCSQFAAVSKEASILDRSELTHGLIDF